jgi:uncharacterized protein YjaG (DUF416 family)
MSGLAFDEVELLKTVERLSVIDRAAFAAACAQRLAPSYAKFSKRSDRGNPAALGKILSRLWHDLTRSEASDVELAALLETCMGLIPQDDDGEWVMEQAAADDAAAALAYAIRCRRAGKANEAVWSARRAFEALYHYVINHEQFDVNEAGAEARILSHPLIQAELSRQNRDLRDLLHGTISVEELRERSTVEGAGRKKGTQLFD